MKKPPSLRKIFYLTGIWAVATISLVQLWIFVGSNIFEYFLYRNNPVIQQAPAYLPFGQIQAALYCK